MPTVKVSVNPRPVQTIYYLRGVIVKTNRARHSNSAVLRCVDHMQFNHYEATTAEVFDETTGVLHAVLRRPIAGDQVIIVFQRPVKENY